MATKAHLPISGCELLDAANRLCRDGLDVNVRMLAVELGRSQQDVQNAVLDDLFCDPRTDGDPDERLEWIIAELRDIPVPRIDADLLAYYSLLRELLRAATEIAIDIRRRLRNRAAVQQRVPDRVPYLISVDADGANLPVEYH